MPNRILNLVQGQTSVAVSRVPFISDKQGLTTKSASCCPTRRSGRREVVEVRGLCRDRFAVPWRVGEGGFSEELFGRVKGIQSAFLVFPCLLPHQRRVPKIAPRAEVRQAIPLFPELSEHRQSEQEPRDVCEKRKERNQRGKCEKTGRRARNDTDKKRDETEHTIQHRGVAIH